MRAAPKLLSAASRRVASRALIQELDNLGLSGGDSLTNKEIIPLSADRGRYTVNRKGAEIRLRV